MLCLYISLCTYARIWEGAFRYIFKQIYISINKYTYIFKYDIILPKIYNVNKGISDVDLSSKKIPKAHLIAFWPSHSTMGWGAMEKNASMFIALSN